MGTESRSAQMELKLKKEMMTTEATLRTNAQRVIQVTQALYQVEELTTRIESSSVRSSGKLVVDRMPELQLSQAENKLTHELNPTSFLASQ